MKDQQVLTPVLTSRQTRSLIFILGALTAFGPLSIDMYLPSLPALAADLDASTSRVQMTLSSYFLGGALGQLLIGPLSDRFGRRPLILAGMGLYVLTSAFCALSSGVEMLIAQRFLQAIGGSAATVLARAMVRDFFSGDRAARILSLIMLVMGAAPLLAPFMGGYLLLLFDWRAIFWTLSVLGAVCFVLVITMVRESHPEERRMRHGLVGMLGVYGRIIRQPAAMGYLASNATAYGGMFAFFAGSPFIYIDLFQVAPENYGLLFACNVIALMLVSMVNARFVTTIGAHRLYVWGTILIAVSGLALLLTAATGYGGLPGIVIPLFIYIGSLSLIGANSIALALDRFPQAAGSVSALSGGITFAIGAVCTSAVGVFHDGSALAMAAVVAAAGLITFALQRLLTRQ